MAAPTPLPVLALAGEGGAVSPAVVAIVNLDSETAQASGLSKTRGSRRMRSWAAVDVVGEVVEVVAGEVLGEAWAGEVEEGEVEEGEVVRVLGDDMRVRGWVKVGGLRRGVNKR